MKPVVKTVTSSRGKELDILCENHEAKPGMLSPSGMKDCPVLPGTVQSQMWVTMLANDTKGLVNSYRYQSHLHTYPSFG